MVPVDPSIDDMKRVVVTEGKRPTIPNKWQSCEVKSVLENIKVRENFSILHTTAFLYILYIAILLFFFWSRNTTITRFKETKNFHCVLCNDFTASRFSPY